MKNRNIIIIAAVSIILIIFGMLLLFLNKEVSEKEYECIKINDSIKKTNEENKSKYEIVSKYYFTYKNKNVKDGWIDVAYNFTNQESYDAFDENDEKSTFEKKWYYNNEKYIKGYTSYILFLKPEQKNITLNDYFDILEKYDFQCNLMNN